MKNNYEIDAVIIWVDGSDPEWQRQRALFSPGKNTDCRTERYRDMGILRYWFRGIETYAPWIRTVHFVTNGQKPSWLDCNSPKIHFVSHQDYMPDKYLPTFNANSIELNLHRIEGLSERFIYFNDDQFIVAPVTPDSFFFHGLPKQSASFLPTYFDVNDPVFCGILKNDLYLIQRHFPHISFFKNLLKYLSVKNGGVRNSLRNAKYLALGIQGIEYSHLPIPFLKSTFAEVWNADNRTLDFTSQHKFRAAEDVNQYIIQYWQIATGKFWPSSANSRGQYFYLPTSYFEAAECIKRQQVKTVCLNDGHFSSEKDYKSCVTEITQAFNAILPQKSSFEL